MPDTRTVAAHYRRDALLDGIEAGMAELGLTRDTVSVEDFGPVDEFHIGGRIATERFLNDVALEANHHVLDIGCGLGGAARFAALKYGCKVTGIDLTEDYINVGRQLGEWVGLQERVSFEHGDATASPFPNDAFDKAFMLHVGMNIPDKVALFSDIRRVLMPGGTFGIYDIMRVGPGELAYPVPWAATANGSAIGSPNEYKQGLESAGFKVTAQRSRRDFALEFFENMQTNMAAAGGPPPLGLHILMGEDAATKLGNMYRGISQDRIAPIEMVAEVVE